MNFSQYMTGIYDRIRINELRCNWDKTKDFVVSLLHPKVLNFDKSFDKSVLYQWAKVKMLKWN